MSFSMEMAFGFLAPVRSPRRPRLRDRSSLPCSLCGKSGPGGSRNGGDWLSSPCPSPLSVDFKEGKECLPMRCPTVKGYCGCLIGLWLLVAIATAAKTIRLYGANYEAATG